jgi:RNA polymerase sigma-70 factor (ECF subfamily)
VVEIDTDDALLWRLARGDTRAFEALFERYVDFVHNVAFRRTADRSAAEDIAETAFLELWRQRQRIVTREGSLRPWLAGVTGNLARRWWRDRTRGRRALGRLAGRSGRSAGPEVGVDDRDMAGEVADRIDDERRMSAVLVALDQLPADQRELVLLSAGDGLSYEEMAAVLDIPVGTVRSRLSRARARLRTVEGISGTAAGLRASPATSSNPTAAPATERGGDR